MRGRYVSSVDSRDLSGQGVVVHIGLDDIDSHFGGCTTHLSYLIVKELLKTLNVEFIDYPNLIRLNPSIPFKTRGNGAVVLRLKTDKSSIKLLVKTLTDMTLKYISEYEVNVGSDPGVALVFGEVPKELSKLYMKALTDYVHRDYLLNILNRLDNVELPLGTSRGVIGALAAIGWPQGSDCTYELLAYRVLRDIGERCVDKTSVKYVDLKYSEYVFNNYDHENDILLITPHSNDPVLLGIRGEYPEVLTNYLNELRICEPISGYMIFRTNQGTDAHLILGSIDDVRPFRTLCLETTLRSKPKYLRGGHLIIKICDEPILYAVFYKESTLTSVISELGIDSKVVLCGSIKQWDNLTNVMNVEKVHIIELVRTYVHNPKCPRCGKRMKSAGVSKGFKCGKCGYRTTNLSKEVVKEVINVNKVYTVKPYRMKHLTKPLCRYGREKQCYYVRPSGDWII